jgi:hypothetical protein
MPVTATLTTCEPPSCDRGLNRDAFRRKLRPTAANPLYIPEADFFPPDLAILYG